LLLRPATYHALVGFARATLEAQGTLSVAALRDHFQTTRRIALPFMDHLEAVGITRRAEDGHHLLAPRWGDLLG
ncbi:MAG: hypothetical protein HC915_07475, partial [Anaerolineae bacterium]|nr:hypothetical protein [Anaerolineae bacterium]